ncbi:MAG TPA: trp operon repressor [Rhabdochlamydiaceae bacterium]|nr:trp operon repressor [Rhabdochlamydiaceae bacterium]HSX13180.1 trp operon repressor [Chlamydiales bacterium]
MTKHDDDNAWFHFLNMCTEFKTASEFKEFFDLFLTLEEKQDLARRFLLVKELLQGNKTQREIAKDLSLSISKITRGSNALKVVRDSLREFLKNHI